MPHEVHRKPILWAFSESRLAQVFQSVAPLFTEAAEIRVFHAAFEAALRTARELVRSGEEVDAFLAAGSNAAYLHDHARVPVVAVTPSALDILQSLTRACNVSHHVAVVSFRSLLPGVEAFGDLQALAVEQRTYVTLEQARGTITELAGRGVDVVVGSGPVCELAEKEGLRSVLLYGQDSVGEAVGHAIDLVRAVQAENARRARVTGILDHLTEGIVAVDMEERIQAVNPALERILGVDSGAVLGKKLSAVAPDLGLARVLESGAAELDGVQKHGSRTLVVNRIPLRERGVQKGALLTCQDSSTIQRLDHNLRSEHRPRRFVARHLLSSLVGASPAIQRMRALAERYAATDATVLLTGESGTGKELVAQGIHNASARRDHPFVAINCAAFPEALLESELFGHDEGAFTGSRRGGRQGLFEAAHTGTIFLDEIGEVPLTLQTRLLRVLQERQVLRLGSNDPTPVDVRVIAATNRDLKAAVAAREFRDDLYYRLNILHLHLPPLRDRPGDLVAIAADLLQRALVRHGAPEVHAAALSRILPRLDAHAWPGNVRELENILERVAVLYAGRGLAPVRDEELRAVVPELFGPEAAAPRAGGQGRNVAVRVRGSDLRSARGAQERAIIQRVLAEAGGNQSEAARRLGIGRSTLWRKLRER